MLAMECADVEAFTFTTLQIRSCLLCKFLSPGATIFLAFRVFCAFLDKRLSSCFIEASSEIKYLQAKQTTCHNMKGLLHW